MMPPMPRKHTPKPTIISRKVDLVCPTPGCPFTDEALCACSEPEVQGC